jgi:hypothetical protein
MRAYQLASTLTVPLLYDKPMVYDIPIVYDNSKKQIDDVSTLKRCLRSCLDLMKDESRLSSLCRTIDHCAQEREKIVVQREVNQVHNKK